MNRGIALREYCPLHWIVGYIAYFPCFFLFDEGVYKNKGIGTKLLMSAVYGYIYQCSAYDLLGGFVG
jgi:hypothetical protein